MEEATLNKFKLDTSTPFLAKIKSGFLLKDILDRFMNKSRAILDPDRSFWVYSGHDITISRILNTLGILKVLNKKYIQFLGTVLVNLFRYFSRVIRPFPHVLCLRCEISAMFRILKYLSKIHQQLPYNLMYQIVDCHVL